MEHCLYWMATSGCCNSPQPPGIVNGKGRIADVSYFGISAQGGRG